jgi:hypothetical protein
MIATIMVGLAISALMAANSTYTVVNSAGLDLSSGEFLIEQMREMTMMTDYNNLLGLHNTTYSPPCDANKQPLNAFSNFTQEITVEKVSSTNFQQVVASSKFVRITVEIEHNGNHLTEASWVRADPN